MTTHPRFLVLTDTDCSQVLARNQVGRLAFVHDGVIDIEPLGYVYDEGWLFLRSAYGTKIEALSHNPFVAFQVDEIRGPFDWRSVVAHGTVYMLDEHGGPIQRREFDRAVTAVRTMAPDALTAKDPTPARQAVYGLHIDRLDGRMAASTPGKPLRRKAQPVPKAPKRRGSPDGS